MSTNRTHIHTVSVLLVCSQSSSICLFSLLICWVSFLHKVTVKTLNHPHRDCRLFPISHATELLPLPTWWRCLNTVPPACLFLIRGPAPRGMSGWVPLFFDSSPIQITHPNLSKWWFAVCLIISLFLIMNFYFCFYVWVVAVMNSRRLYVSLFSVTLHLRSRSTSVCLKSLPYGRARGLLG